MFQMGWMQKGIFIVHRFRVIYLNSMVDRIRFGITE